MNRIESLCAALSWPQTSLAAYLGVSQTTVSRLALGGRETGPVAQHLDQLQCGIDSGVIAAGMTPESAQAALRAAILRGEG